ncbi:MAG: AEC family transporter [Clostridia bacterium]|nr:AEC family transporter [Clostridia bacterium]
MEIFLSTLSQMGFLLVLIASGYIVTRLGVVDEKAATVLSKLENNIFIPALILSTFIKNFTVERLGSAWKFFICGAIVVLLSIPIAYLGARMCTKDAYIKKLFIYSLTFANFGFMGNAVVLALFPDMFMEYVIFVIPFWILIYGWAVPTLLVPSEHHSGKLADKLKPFLNPMFISIPIGAIIGLCKTPMPEFLESSIDSLGSCMSPLAMLLTGITIAKINLKTTFKNIEIYKVTFLRLIVIPVIAIAVLMLVKLPYEIALCTMCALSMPLGLNTIVVPGAYGKDTTVGAGMALISHLLSVATIPLVFMLFDLLVK